jgi:hypothetical protein
MMLAVEKTDFDFDDLTSYPKSRGTLGPKLSSLDLMLLKAEDCDAR